MAHDDAAPASSGSSIAGYDAKNDGYFGGVRRDFLALLPKDGQARVLEIGCGAGETGAAALAEGRCTSYSGVEIVPRAAELARGRLTEVLEGDVERLELPWEDASFDAILMSEVLEHLVDPWTVVRRLADKLKPGAVVLASSPNVAQAAVVRDLLANRWELTETGVMDRTHLRWFTRDSYRRLFEDAGIRVEKVRSMAPPGRLGKLFNMITLNRFDHLTMRQICIEGRKA